MVSLLIIDDEAKHRNLLARLLKNEGYDVSEAGSGKDAISFISNHSPDIIICDVKLPDANGVELTRRLMEQLPDVEIILLTAFGNIPDSVQSIKNGAFDYLVKGDDNDRIIPLLARAAEKVQLRRKVSRLEKQIGKSYTFESILGSGTAIKNAIELAKKVSPTDASILLTGETGTGKEVFAQAIHYNSKRAAQAFVALNCSAISKDLLESELFGHKAGAFTGAVKDKKGLVEEADGGTLFLDEIGEMSPDIQPKILRLLENGTYIPVGGTKEQKSNVRIIAATNRDLKLEVQQGQFRQDLYFRIAVFIIELPPLRERISDIPLLAEHYLAVYAAKTNKSIKGITADAVNALKSNDWKGNVRELKNVIERAVILEDGDVLSLSSLPFELQQAKQDNKTLSAFHLSSVEKLHIQKVLNYTNGNKAEAARLMNIGLATLYRKIEEYQLKSR